MDSVSKRDVQRPRDLHELTVRGYGPDRVDGLCHGHELQVRRLKDHHDAALIVVQGAHRADAIPQTQLAIDNGRCSSFGELAQDERIGFLVG